MLRQKAAVLWKAIALGVLANMGVQSMSRAGTLSFGCGFTPSEIATMNRANTMGAGYAMNTGQRFNFSVDTNAHTATVLGPPTDTYTATVTPSTVSWSTPRDEDGESATFSFDLATYVLTTVDPEGQQTLWDCGKP